MRRQHHDPEFGTLPFLASTSTIRPVPPPSGFSDQPGIVRAISFSAALSKQSRWWQVSISSAN
jgi:hypothetical protein